MDDAPNSGGHVESNVVVVEAQVISSSAAPQSSVSAATLAVNNFDKKRRSVVLNLVMKLCVSGAIMLGYLYQGLAFDTDSDLCPTSPLNWRTFFLVSAASICVGISLLAGLIWVAKLVTNDHWIRAQVYRQQGRETEAAEAERESRPAREFGLSVGRQLKFVLVLWALFALAWGIVGWVIYANSPGGEVEECKLFERWWIGAYLIVVLMNVLPAVRRRAAAQSNTTGDSAPGALQATVIGGPGPAPSFLTTIMTPAVVAQDDANTAAKKADAYRQLLSKAETGPATTTVRLPQKVTTAGGSSVGAKAQNSDLEEAVRRILSAPDARNLRAEDLAALIQGAAKDIQDGNYMQNNEVVSPTAFMPSPPCPFDELTPAGLLGFGSGFAMVGLCEHRPTGTAYALKTMSKGNFCMNDTENWLVREKLAFCAVRSPFVAKFFGHYNRGGAIHFLQEPTIGGELFTVYKKYKLHGSAPHAKYYVASVASAVQHMHSLHLLFRDIKPENVFLDAAGRALLIDLEMSKFVVSKTHTTTGTPDYFSPELINANGVSFGHDWWTIGAFLFEAMAGSPPFESSMPMEIYSKVIRGIDQVKFSAKLKGPCEGLVKSLMRPKPEDRLPLNSGGWNSFREHAFFAGFDWTAFDSLAMSAPYLPTTRGPADLSNYNCNPADAPKATPLTGMTSSVDWAVEFGNSTDDQNAFSTEV